MDQHTSANGANVLAVLVSGGLDSAILLGESLRRHDAVHPLYVRTGLLWEADELHHLGLFLGALQSPRLKPLHILELPVADLYGPHWSLTGRGVPGADTPDKAVYLPGRNVLLLSKSLLWCHLNGAPALAVGSLRGNPFPDATPEFFDAFAAVVGRAIGGAVEVRRPFLELSKTDVMCRGRNLPLRWTFSCIRPLGGKHCGACNKCAERRRAFRDAGMDDPTEYAAPTATAGRG